MIVRALDLVLAAQRPGPVPVSLHVAVSTMRLYHSDEGSETQAIVRVIGFILPRGAFFKPSPKP